MTMRMIAATSLLLLAWPQHVGAAPPTAGLALQQASKGYPVRIGLLSPKERQLRTRQLELQNPGWKLVVDSRGYIQQAREAFSPQSTLRKDFASWHRKGKMPARYLTRIKRFITKNKKQLAQRVRRLRTAVALGNSQGTPSWTLHFARGRERIGRKRLSNNKLYGKLLKGRRVVISRSVCPPCRPGGQCACAKTTLLDRPATRAATKLLIQQAVFSSATFVELRMVASLLPRRRPHARSFAKGWPSGATAHVQPSGHIDAVTGRAIDPAKEAVYPSGVKPGIWISCPGCTDPFLGAKKVH